MAYPTPIVEIAFDDGPYTASPTWTPVTQYVRRMSIDRGRSDDWGDFNGTATVVLNNRTRLFDPFYTSGTYYGKLLPRRQIRIRAETVELGVTTTHDVFRGFIDGWNPQWTDAGTDSTTTIQCFDALQLLAGEQLPADWSRPYILSLNPRHYYPCDEPLVSFQVNTIKDYGSFPLNITTTTNASNSPELAPGLPSHSVQAVGVGGLGTTGLYTPGASPNEFTFALWGVFDAANAVACGFTNAAMGIGYDQNTGKYVVEVSDVGAGNVKILTTTNTYDNSTARHIASTFNATTKAQELYIDGVLVPTTTTTTGAILFGAESVTLDNGQFQQVCVFTSKLTQAQIQTIYNYSLANFPETTAARFTRLIAETPFPASLTQTATAPVNSVLDITNNAPPVTSELRTVALSEGGPLFVSKNGTLTMFNQNQIFSQTKSVVSQVTYGSGGSKMGEDVQITSDGDSMRNQVFVSMSGGGVYQKDNATSITTYGSASISLDTQVQTLANAESLGQITSGFGGNIYPDLTPVDVVLSADELWKPTLDLELNERITVNIAPPTGNVISTPMLVQRITHDVVPGYWQTTLDGSARWAAVFILDQSLLDGTDLLG
jgi:hypothetical protein